jgi:hypothetical protein
VGVDAEYRPLVRLPPQEQSPQTLRSLPDNVIGGGNNGTWIIVVDAGRAYSGDPSALAVLRPLIA